MKGSVHPKNDVSINPSANETILDVLGRIDDGRRRFIKTALSSSTLAAMGGVSSLGLIQAVEAAPVGPANGFAGIGFESIPPSVATLNPATGAIVTPIADMVKVPAGYKVEILVAWGDPVTKDGQPWAEDATQGAAEQEQQFGMHNDGMHYFPFPERGGSVGKSNIASSERGLLCVNHEYTHEAILHPGGLTPVTIAKVRKSQAAHGVSVMEVRRNGGKWAVQAHSPWGRRITGNTPMRISGPAAGHPLLQSKKYDVRPDGSFESGVNNGFEVRGTLNNCAHGWTPWGTYITCEENWNGYFGTVTSPYTPTKLERRYGVTAAGFGYQWHVVDDRFDIVKNPREPNLFGWAVEIDPFDPQSVPVKRTALGRIKRESAQVAMDENYRVAFYQGDDERNEYIYKFVCGRPYNPRSRAANRDMLDAGVTYVAKFTDTPVPGKAGTYRGRWIPLVPDQEAEAWPVDPALGRKPKLRELPEFAAPTDAEVQALILIKMRMAGDAVGATMMDRPEWVALRTYLEGRTPANGYTNTYQAVEFFVIAATEGPGHERPE
jgi:secreted PhoX family phosphatase